MRYPAERKEAILKKMAPPMNMTIPELAEQEGILSGGSTGTVFVGALEEARKLGPGKIVVAIVCDGGDRYISKVFNDEWMRNFGYIDADEQSDRPPLSTVTH